MNISFSNKSTISFFRDAMNDDTRLIASIVLKMKLAIDEKNFLSRPRSRLIDAMSIIESIVMKSACSEIDSIDDLTDDLVDDSIDDLTDDSIDDSVDENDNSSLI
jgi:hypothetical protein